MGWHEDNEGNNLDLGKYDEKCLNVKIVKNID